MRKFALIVATGIGLIAPSVFAQFRFQDSLRVPSQDISSLLLPLSSYSKLGSSQKFEVKGEIALQGATLYVDEIVFYPGAKLLLTGAFGDRGEKTIIARRLRIVSSEVDAPPQITWLREEKESRYPPPAGKAAPGASGRFDGDSGQKGNDGAVGNPGYPGRNAPNVILVVKEVVGSKLSVDLRGQIGGSGGQGQTGGDGGLGRPGRSGSSSLFDCKRGPDRGGNGGNGGSGGPGGTGGKGGDGGTLVVFAPQAALERLADSLMVDTRGGEPGAGGGPGDGGEPGFGGPGGRPNGLCFGSGSGGDLGSRGLKGAIGVPGFPGEVGDVRAAPLTPQNLTALGL